MILRRYGTNVQSVEPNFDAHAMTEIGFLRTDDFRSDADEFEAEYERADLRELHATATGEVQSEVEQAVLEDLKSRLRALEDEQDGRVLVIENRPGVDPPKTRGDQTGRVVQGVNRLVFEYTVDPPLRVGIYQRKGG